MLSKFRAVASVGAAAMPSAVSLVCQLPLAVYLLRLVFKNALRHELRITLTAVRMVVAIAAFGLLRTNVDARLS